MITNDCVWTQHENNTKRVSKLVEASLLDRSKIKKIEKEKWIKINDSRLFSFFHI